MKAHLMTDARKDIVERLREPVMLRYNAEQVNAERREAADEIERLRARSTHTTIEPANGFVNPDDVEEL